MLDALATRLRPTRPDVTAAAPSRRPSALELLLAGAATAVVALLLWPRGQPLRRRAADRHLDPAAHAHAHAHDPPRDRDGHAAGRLGHADGDDSGDGAAVPAAPGPLTGRFRLRGDRPAPIGSGRQPPLRGAAMKLRRAPAAVSSSGRCRAAAKSIMTATNSDIT